MRKRIYDTATTLFLKRDMYDQLQTIAEQEERSLSEIIRRLVEKGLTIKEKGK